MLKDRLGNFSLMRQPTVVTVSITEGIARIVDMETGTTMIGEAPLPRRGRPMIAHAPRMNFQITIPAHSYAAFNEVH